jgi:hypothetical protein
MSFQFNSDKEIIQAVNPKLVGSNELTIRSGEGASEKEIFRAQLDPQTGLPRVGINRTGRRVESIRINEGQGGTGYTLTPNVTLSSPNLSNGIQALASAVVFNGSVVAIIVDNPGDGYTSAPSVTITGGNGAGAAATAVLDTVDFELDINGAIRTSTSIISDTARILNLDIDNFVTPDASFRGPNLKTWANGTGIQFVPNVVLQKDSYRYAADNIYQALNTGTTGTTLPTHKDGIALSGNVQLKHVGYRVNDVNAPYYLETGESGLFPRSITPLLGDKSDKIATTEYVLNLATNDVGGRVYVSQQIGNDQNDGRSAVAPVRTIKRACQIASATVGVKETVIVSGGDYVEDNPISIPADCSIVGDNLRLVIVRPANPRKHMFKFGDKNYLTGLVFRDQIDSNGDPVATWDFAMVFDDRQRIYYDSTTGGDFGRNFPIGHQIFGPPRIRVTFQNHTGGTELIAGLTVTGVNTGATGLIAGVTFESTTGPDAYVNGTIDVDITSGSFNNGETFEYTVGIAPSQQTYDLISTDITSIRAEGEVVSNNKDLATSLPIVRIDFSQQGTPETSEGGFQYDPAEDNSGGIIFYTNALVGRQNTHDFKEGQQIEIQGLPTTGPDLSYLNGKQRIYKILRDADGRARRFIIQNKQNDSLTDSNFIPNNASVKSYDYSVTVSLLNSPNKFGVAESISRRFQDAGILIRNNIPFIIDEAYLQIQEEFEYLAVPNEVKCRRDIGHFLNALIRDLEYGSNYHTIEAAQTYIQNAQIGYLGNEITESVRAYEIAKDLAILAMRRWRTGNGQLTDPLYTPQYSSVVRYFDPTVIQDGIGAACEDVASAINTLGYLFVEVITNNAVDRYLDASELIARNTNFIASEALGYAKAQYPSLGLSTQDETKCLRDIRYILSALRRDLTLGGNAGILTAAEAYFTGAQLTGIPEAELSPTRYAFEKVRDLAILAMRNWKTGNGTGPVYTRLYETTIPLYTDSTIAIDPATPICANVASAITTSFALLDDVLSGEVLPGATAKTYGTLYDTVNIVSYPDNTLYDANNKVITPRATWDDLPYIEASPYTQNASVISFLGGGGALIDGSKVAQPNCPFPGLELDGSASFPNQGKSMVAAAFTIVSFNGVGYKIINDGYVQLVSVFVLFAADGVLAESGGYASITNSATNFGIYALRARGYNSFAYSFDVGTITNVSTTPTGRTIFTVDGLGREPLEHYIVKIDGYSNLNTEIEYFVDTVAGVTVGPPFSAQITLESGSGDPAEFIRDSDNVAVSTGIGEFSGKTLRLFRPSIVNSSSHTWEFAGSGTNYNALPENGGVKIDANEQVSQDYGRVYCSGTDELGDFKVGTFAKIENRTGNITFTGTVTISEVEFLKLKGGDVVVTGFDNSNTLGGANSTDSKLPTQKAVRDYITNNLGPYINKPYSTNAVPRALVELTDSGKISIDQIPPLRPFNVYTVEDQAERLSIEGALAGDIAIQQDTGTSYILNNDNDSLFVSFAVNTDLAFTIGNIFTGDLSGGQIQATEYRPGVVYQISLSNAGSGYTVPPTVTISGGNPGVGAIQASAVATIANGQVVTVSIIEFNGFIGGKGYTTPPTITFSAPGGAGITATGSCLIESRLYGDIVNNIKISDTDSIQSSNSPEETVNINRSVNTSANDANNWVSLSTTQISATDITSGVISTSRLANNSDAANSFTFLRGDQSYAPVLQSIKGAEVRYFAKLIQQANTGSSQLVFSTNSNTLLGHTVIDNVSGIAANTNITGVLSAAGITTVSINNPLTQNIPSGTIIEFLRGASPLTFESSLTQGNFVDTIVIVNGGSGYTSGQYFDVPLTGGSGTGLRCNIIVSGGVVTEITTTNSGQNYTGDFNITSSPAAIGPGSGLVLSAKISTVNRQYANTSVDIQRVSDLTISADPFGTVGVARFLKSQFTIGQSGNGSIQLKTGPDSGLDADLLDGAQGAFYLNASNLNSGTVSTDRLSGTYNISISGQSGNTLRLISSTSNPTSNPSPSNFATGVIADTKNNSADGLNDGGSRHLVMSIRNGGAGFDATFGGVRQLAFTDNDNMWLRGSGNNVTEFGSWGKVWTSLNDGPGTDLDADKLDNRQGTWYQNAFNINFGTLSDNRLPSYQTTKSFNNSVKVLTTTNNPRYKIYVSGLLLTTAPFLAGLEVNLYNANAQGTGTILITNIETFDDATDNNNDYTIITGSLQTGTFIGALTIGTASNRITFQDFSLDVSGTFQTASLDSDGGIARLKLGRKDGTASSPAIYFSSSQLVASDYNVALVASGGNNSNGSGSLNVIVANANGLTVNNNTVWNAGNVTFNSTNIVSTAVIRDASGNFAAGTITAALTGAASANVLKAGDTMTGSLTISGASSNLSVGGTLSVTGATTLTGNLTVDTNTLFVDAANNKVAIGSTSVDRKLTVFDDQEWGITLRMANNTLTNRPTHHTQRALGTLSSPLTVTDGTYIGGVTSGAYDGTQFTNGWNGGVEILAIANETWSSTAHGSYLIFNTTAVGSVSPTTKMRINATTNAEVGIGKTASTGIALDVSGIVRASTNVTIRDASDNSGAPLLFLGSSTFRNFRVGNQLLANDVFEITPSTTGGGTTWASTPAFAIRGSDGSVGVGTTAFTVGSNTYRMNVNGNLNFNGILYQNDQVFVASRWTSSTNTLDIHRLSRVGIGVADPTWTLQVGGSGNNGVNIQGTNFSSGVNNSVLYANGDRQWLDSFGVFKANRNTVAENVTVPSNTNCMTVGPITINTNTIITVQTNAAWSII